MATCPKDPQSDTDLAEKTVRFLGAQLRTGQFVLRACVKARKNAVQNETVVRKQVKTLVLRIQREFDAHPGLFRSHGKPQDYTQGSAEE